MRMVHWATAIVLVVAVTAFARYFLLRQETAALQAEIAMLRQENGQLAELRAEHSRLLASRISDTELERLRNDRAALTRLRAEINKLEESADRKTRAVQQPAARTPAGTILNVGLTSSGGLMLNGTPTDQAALRQLLSGFAARSEPVDIRVQVAPRETPMTVVKETIDGISRLAKELGLRMSLRFETR